MAAEIEFNKENVETRQGTSLNGRITVNQVERKERI